MVDHDHLQRVSEAFDGAAPMPADLDPDAQAFLAASARLRARFRIEEAEVPPDLTDAVLTAVRAQPARAPHGRSVVRVAAGAFLVAALTAAALTAALSPDGPSPALADIGDDVIQAQADVLALDATVTLVERGAHPDVPVRSYGGTLRYRAPEQLWLHLADETDRPDAWPANDLDLVVDDGTTWTAGLLGCPPGEQPACLRATTRVTTRLAPFAADVVAPLDLIVPVGAFLPTAEVTAVEADGLVTVTTTVARVQDLVDGLRAAGSVRSVHATDVVLLGLDARSLTLRGLRVEASATAARDVWAASAGYRDSPGTAVLELTVTPSDLPDSAYPRVPGGDERDGGFHDTSPSGTIEPSWLPPGFSSHRAGTEVGPGPRTAIRSWSNGRAWIRLDATSEHSGNVLFGPVGPIVRRIAVRGGVGYADPTGQVLSLHTEDVDLVLTGSVPLAQLVSVAASLPLVGQTVPEDWPQGDVLTEVPRGALRADGPLIGRYDGADLLAVVPGPGQTSAILRQRPGSVLSPPFKTDVVEVEIRGTVGRYFPATQMVTWVEDGWVRELSSEGLGLDGLLAVSTDLHP